MSKPMAAPFLPRTLFDTESVGKAAERLAEAAGKAARAALKLGREAALGPLPHPEVMIMMIGKRCNLKCEFCELWKYTDLMRASMACHVIDQARTLGIPNLVITGGEPFVHPGIFEIISHAKNAHMGLNITTNGFFLRRDAQRITELKVDSLSVSIDGPREVHDHLRGRKGSFDRIQDGFAALREAGYPGIVNIYFVTTNKNVFHLRAMYEFAKERGFKFNFWPVNDAPDLHVRTEEEKTAYLDFCDWVVENDPDFHGRKDYYRAGLRYHSGAPFNVRCLGVEQQVGVFYNGDVIPCCMWGDPSLTIGNVFSQPLADILRSQSCSRTMEGMQTRGCDNGCFNHSLYEYNVRTGKPFIIEKGTVAQR
ncbi:MAG: Coenzyme PQQ synthesis protein E [Myxococcota bacterium]|nr:Coenzyme PQQ synthesis protein E [Myxococcota bacterium]